MSAGGRPLKGPASGRFGHKGRKLPAGRCACLASVLSGAGVCLAVWQYIYFSRTCFRVPDVSGFRMKSFPTEGIYGRGLSRIRDLRTQAATDRYGDPMCNQPGTLKYMIASVCVRRNREEAMQGRFRGGAEVARTSVGLCRAFVVRPADFPPGRRRHGMRRRRTACTIRTELTMFAEMRIVSGPVAQAAERAFLFAVTASRRSFPDDSRASL